VAHTQNTNAHELLRDELARLNMEYGLAISVINDLIRHTAPQNDPEHDKTCNRCVDIALVIQVHQDRIRKFRLSLEKKLAKHFNRTRRLAQQP
jgi:hypothetical protein